MSAQLSRKILSSVAGNNISVPDEAYFSLPEKVLQFGTGVLLRGLPDYFIDKANKKGIFNGRIVVVKSTGNGSADEFSVQDGLYTHCVKGFEAGDTVSEWHVNASISRVLSAQAQWNEIIACAANPFMELVISNTTEVGIQLVKESIHDNPPTSYPAKLLAFLYKRYQVFNGDADKGMVIIPTELIPDNGTKLKNILIELAAYNELEEAFISWLKEHNECCNSLVDRIVPGKLPAIQQQAAEKELGYKDDLMIMSETYRLWAIESSSVKTKNVLSFAYADEGVVIAPSINKFRELKLRLLNGSHTFTCGLAYLAGFPTVKEAMDNEGFSTFIEQLMKTEIIPSIVSDEITPGEAEQFANSVLDRYRNPFIEHQWISITMEYSSKMKMRCIPVLLAYCDKFNTLPSLMTAGFAAHLQFMKSIGKDGEKHMGTCYGKTYVINDSNATVYATAWSGEDNQGTVNKILSDTALWGLDLTQLSGFKDMIVENLNLIQNIGVKSILQSVKIS
jgi:tagaturonate reductase